MKTLIFLGLFAFASAQTIANNGKPLTRMPQSAMAASLGNASTLLEPHSASFFYNPATLVNLRRDMFNVGLQNLSQDRTIYLLSYYKSLNRKAFFSVGFIQAGIDDLYEYDKEGIRGSSINFSDNLFYVSGGFKPIRSLSIGISVNYMFDNINSTSIDDYKSTSIGIDLGAIYYLGYQTLIGATVKNLNGSVETNSDNENLFEFIHEEEVPKVYTIGIRTGILSRYTKIAGIDVFADYKMNEGLKNTTHFGFQFKTRAIPFRIGVNDGDLTYGLGLRFRLFSRTVAMNYGYIPSNLNEGNSHIFDWSVLF